MKLPHHQTTGGNCMNYHHLTIEERSCIRKYYVDGLSYREIARLIGRNVSTVSREIRRNCSHMYDIPTYYPHTAQKKYLLRRSYCHRGMHWNEDVIAYIEEKLKATWSPKQIACTPCELHILSWRTIYRWIYEKYLVNGNSRNVMRFTTCSSLRLRGCGRDCGCPSSPASWPGSCE